jgi:hypothetical protein
MNFLLKVLSWCLLRPRHRHHHGGLLPADRRCQLCHASLVSASFSYCVSLSLLLLLHGSCSRHCNFCCSLVCCDMVCWGQLGGGRAQSKCDLKKGSLRSCRSLTICRLGSSVGRCTQQGQLQLQMSMVHNLFRYGHTWILLFRHALL